jgi:hypothetical protein
MSDTVYSFKCRCGVWHRVRIVGDDAELMVAPVNTAQQAKVASATKYGGGRVEPCGHYVNYGEQCHICKPATIG